MGTVVPHSDKPTGIRERSEALRQLILLLEVGSLVCEWTLLSSCLQESLLHQL